MHVSVNNMLTILYAFFVYSCLDLSKGTQDYGLMGHMLVDRPLIRTRDITS